MKVCKDELDELAMKLCPCGSQKRYLDCCGAYLEKKVKAESPLALMRSRYTAFVEKKFDYIQKTMRPPALLKFNKKSAKKESVQWLALKVVATAFDPNDENIGFVEFEASYKQEETTQTMHERSEFHCIDGVWYYVDGEK